MLYINPISYSPRKGINQKIPAKNVYTNQYIDHNLVSVLVCNAVWVSFKGMTKVNSSDTRQLIQAISFVCLLDNILYFINMTFRIMTYYILLFVESCVFYHFKQKYQRYTSITKTINNPNTSYKSNIRIIQSTNPWCRNLSLNSRTT